MEVYILEKEIYEKLNDIKDLDDYIKNYCAYGCHYFLLKKIKNAN